LFNLDGQIKQFGEKLLFFSFLNLHIHISVVGRGNLNLLINKTKRALSRELGGGGALD
jgi:hypothetical protein